MSRWELSMNHVSHEESIQPIVNKKSRMKTIVSVLKVKWLVACSTHQSYTEPPEITLHKTPPPPLPHLLRNCLLLDHPHPTAISVALRGGYGYFLDHHNLLCKSASTLLLMIFYVKITSIKFPNYSALILRITSHQLEYVEGNSANKSCKAMATTMHLESHMLH